MTDIIIFAGSLLASMLLTGMVRRFALARGLLDVPNQRSSHVVPVPRGGGLAIVLVCLGAGAALACVGRADADLLLPLATGGTLIAVVGFLDDRGHVPALARLAVHLIAAGVAVWWLGGLPPVRFGGMVISLGWAGYVCAGLGLVWSVNLFNFMDGLDGIAGSEGVFITGAAGALGWFFPGFGGSAPLLLAFCAACLGFLVWNWPPARIFMGDVGSGFVGFTIGVAALATARSEPAALWVWAILGGVFLVDASVTLARRMLRGKRVYEAHRSHAYQRLARSWRSHLKVTLAVQAVNLCWLLPWAVFALRFPSRASLAAALALLPLTALALLMGAGREVE